jgi:hypothetical protein
MFFSRFIREYNILPSKVIILEKKFMTMGLDGFATELPQNNSSGIRELERKTKL